ncbi:MAG: DUF192 domain-containing protein [Rhizobiaceae bacterium]
MKQLLLSALCALVLMAAAPFQSSASGMNQVTIQTGNGPQAWTIELASDNESRAKGLMFRQNMAPKAGMLFRFEQSRVVSMWMKNTFVALDMIFADQAGVVTHIHRGAVPQSLAIISSQVPARFVLEVNAGEADHFGVAVGNQLAHPWILPGG